MHPATLRLQTGHPRLSEEHAGPLGTGRPCMQVQGQEVCLALCCSVSLIGPQGHVVLFH